MRRIDRLSAELRAAKTPPLHEWRPREALDLGLRIDAGGRWFYRDSEIQRARLVALFASVLRLEPDGGHYLITPRLKYPVAVEDAPFIAVEMQRAGAGTAQTLAFGTNVGDWVTAGRAHPLRVTDAAGQLSPRIEVRAGLQAKLSRAVYYELAELATPPAAGAIDAGDDEPAGDESGGGESNDKVDDNAGDLLGVYSNGAFFPLGRA